MESTTEGRVRSIGATDQRRLADVNLARVLGATVVVVVLAYFVVLVLVMIPKA